jgi:hypothetical protein
MADKEVALNNKKFLTQMSEMDKVVDRQLERETKMIMNTNTTDTRE